MKLHVCASVYHILLLYFTEGNINCITEHDSFDVLCKYGAPFRPKIVEKNALVENRRSCVEKNLHVVKSAKNDETISLRFHLPDFVELIELFELRVAATK